MSIDNRSMLEQPVDQQIEKNGAAVGLSLGSQERKGKSPASTPEMVLNASIAYVESGLSLIPISADGTKSPDWLRLPKVWDERENRYKRSWKLFQVRRPTIEELTGWYQTGYSFGLAIVAGTVSGSERGVGLEIIDFDTAELAAPWSEAIAEKCPQLPERLVRVQSPRPGLHIYYRCRTFGGSQKLAIGPLVDEHGVTICNPKNGKPKKKTLIELKGEGGYCLAPPSPPACHPSGKAYEVVEGSPELTQIPTITPEEREILLNAARKLNRWTEPEPARRQRCETQLPASAARPGDDLNARGDWSDILKPHGWTFVDNRDGVEHWCRPGKSTGSSATVNYSDCNLLFVFSSNADPFEEGQAYTKFAAYTLLEHEGDYHAAAAALRGMGYGL
jgi:putative DNA primase/helicase